jgi:hypothetical protein
VSERIVIKATEPQYVRGKGDQRVPIDLSTTVPKRKRIAFKRGSMLLRWWRRRPKRVSHEEQARRDAEYAADYERWLTVQGYDTTPTREREGDALPPVGDDGTFQ